MSAKDDRKWAVSNGGSDASISPTTYAFQIMAYLIASQYNMLLLLFYLKQQLCGGTLSVTRVKYNTLHLEEYLLLITTLQKKKKKNTLLQ